MPITVGVQITMPKNNTITNTEAAEGAVDNVNVWCTSKFLIHEISGLCTSVGPIMNKNRNS